MTENIKKIGDLHETSMETNGNKMGTFPTCSSMS